MKKILLILMLLPFIAEAQFINKNTGYGTSFNRTGADTLLFLPRDTFPVPTTYRAYAFIARKGTDIYVWNTSTFVWQLSSGGAAIDTTNKWVQEVYTSPGVNQDTLYEWDKVHPDFSEAKKIGFERSRLTWEKIGLDLAKTGTGNATAFIFNMKNRFKKEWRDKVENGFTNEDGEDISPIQIIQIPDNGRNKASTGLSGESPI